MHANIEIKRATNVAKTVDRNREAIANLLEDFTIIEKEKLMGRGV